MSNNYTELKDAFHFSTTMPDKSIIKGQRFSLECIYCKSKNTIELLSDGSFRKCMNSLCKRNFQARFIQAQQIFKPPPPQTKHPNDYIFNQQPQLMQQYYQNQNQNQNQPKALEANLPNQQQFSQPNYDPQIKYK